MDAGKFYPLQSFSLFGCPRCHRVAYGPPEVTSKVCFIGPDHPTNVQMRKLAVFDMGERETKEAR